MDTNEIARIAALVGEPARTGMLLELMDGRSLTANELSRIGGISAPTASRHLGLMVEAGLLEVTPTGRHRYYRLASENVAKVLEGIMRLASLARARPSPSVVVGPKDGQMRLARTCYDHIAGRLGVAIAETLVERGAVQFSGDSGVVTACAPAVLAPLGIDGLALGSLPPAKRAVHCKPCLDWSERKPHLAGSLGRMLCAHCLQQGWLRKREHSRSLEITPEGSRELGAWMGMERWDQVQATHK